MKVKNTTITNSLIALSFAIFASTASYAETKAKIPAENTEAVICHCELPGPYGLSTNILGADNCGKCEQVCPHNGLGWKFSGDCDKLKDEKFVN